MECYVVWSLDTGPLAVVYADSLREAIRMYTQDSADAEDISLEEAAKDIRQAREAGLRFDVVETVLRRS